MIGYILFVVLVVTFLASCLVAVDNPYGKRNAKAEFIAAVRSLWYCSQYIEPSKV